MNNRLVERWDCPQCGQDLRLPPNAWAHIAELTQTNAALTEAVAMRQEMLDDVEDRLNHLHVATTNEGHDQKVSTWRRVEILGKRIAELERQLENYRSVAHSMSLEGQPTKLSRLMELEQENKQHKRYGQLEFEARVKYQKRVTDLEARLRESIDLWEAEQSLELLLTRLRALLDGTK